MGFNLEFSPETLKAALLVSLLSVWLLVALFAYLNSYTKRRYFTLWMVAWLFYAVWLTLGFAEESMLENPFVLMAKQSCVGISAVFLFWGSQVFMGQRERQKLFGLFIIFLLLWSYVGVYFLKENLLQAKLPVFGLMGLAGLLAARSFFKYRLQQNYIGASLLAVGFLLWGVYLAGYPLWERNKDLQAASFFISAVLQLFIAVSMIILVLEEARAAKQLFLEKSLTERAARVGLESQVRSSEDRYRKLFDQASDAIIITNTTNLGILEMNQRAEKLLAIKSFEADRHLLSAFFKDTAASSPARTGAEQFAAVRRQGPLDIVGKNGGVTRVEAEATSIEFEGRPAYQFVLREMTERARLEQQLRQSEKLSALGHMISGIAHELNNPLAVIKGYLELILAHHDLPEATRADLTKVANESNRAAKLVRNFLVFAREQPAHRANVDFNELIERVALLRKFDLLVAGVEVQFDLAPQLPSTQADPDQIQQLVVNLMNNSMQAIAPLARPGIIRLGTQQKDNLIHVTIEDNGPGVPKELESKIFEPFFTTKDVGTGTGLGLSIAHSIMTEHQGRIFYRTSVLGGAGFVLEFPVTEAKPAPAISTDTQFFFKDKPPTQSARILVLDDEKVLAEMLGEMLSHLGHQITLCHLPMQALDLIRKEKFDVILSDFRMPILDGHQFHTEVSKIDPALAHRIIFLTGDVVNEETQSFLASIGNPHLSKPFQLDAVRRAVTQVIEAKK